MVPSNVLSAVYTVVTGTDVLTFNPYTISATSLVVVSAQHGLQVLGIGYAVTLPVVDGGATTVTLVGQTPGDTITITRVVPYTQPTQLPVQGALSPPTLESMSDNLEMQIQQLDAAIVAIQAGGGGGGGGGGSFTQVGFFQSASGTGGIWMWNALLNAKVYLYSTEDGNGNPVLTLSSTQPA